MTARSVPELSAAQKTELSELFGEYVNLDKRDRHYYNHDIGALPPLVKKVKHIISGFEQSWINFAFEIINAEETVCVWERPETEQILGQIQAMKTMVEIGVPLITVLKRFGWSIDDISQMEQDMKEEKARNASIMDEQILLAMARMQQNPNPLNPNGLNLTDSERGTAN